MMGAWAGGASWWVSGLLSLILLGALVVGVVWAIDRLRSQRGQEVGSARFESALDILKKRYARGEIGKEEFDTKRRDLS
ncbi:MAG: SHOCT domain-containing protein [candidate division NC10 bacterium]|nr:SHOCT domain-containing protein [candidate division NC10 bacterium]